VAKRGLRTTILRFGTVYGHAPVTRFEAVANRFALLAGTRRPLTVYGDGTQTRPFVHVRDASAAVCWALSHPDQAAGKTLNVLERNASVLDLVTAVRATDPDVETRRTEQDIRTHLSFELDGSVLQSLGWAPSQHLSDGLGELLDHLQGFTAPAHLTRTSLDAYDI